VISGLLQGLERIERLAGIAILKGVLVLLGSAVLVPILGLVGVLVASTVAEVIAWCAALSPLHVAYRAASRGTLRAVDARMLWRAGGTALPVFLNGLALWGTALLVRSALATSGGFTDIGYFQIADSVARVVALVPAALAVPLMPLLASDPGRARTLVGPAIRIAVLGALLPALFLSVAAGPLIGALYGPVYLPAATIAAVLVFVAFLQTIGTIVWTVLVGGGNAWTGFAVQATGYVALAVLVMVLVPSFGLTGATSAYLASAAIATAASVWYLRRIPGATSPDLWRAGWIAALGWLLVAAWYVVGIVGALPALATVTIVAAVGWRPFGRTAFERVRVTLGRHAAA
jgi:O-antigen/teichoic acid export membrane protein